MPGFRPIAAARTPLTGTSRGSLPPPSRGYNPLYPTRIEPPGYRARIGLVQQTFSSYVSKR